MIYLMMFLAGLAFVGLVGYGIFALVGHFTSDAVRSGKWKDAVIEDNERQIDALIIRNRVAVDALNKITAGYAHNNALTARDALDEMVRLEIEERSK